MCRARDRRSEIRDLCAELVEIWWERGRTVVILENVSATGGGIVSAIPVPEGALLRLALPAGEQQATVRYCIAQNGVYIVGLRFRLDERRPFPLGVEHLFRLTRAD
jgi:hypothetical protein